MGRQRSLNEREVTYWVNEIQAALKREESYRKKAERVLDIYEQERAQENSFNILWSNTETLLPAVYNALPRPVVTRRYKDPDPVGLDTSTAVTRLLEYTLDNPNEAYASFDSLIEQSVTGALLPGRGITRFRYHAEYEKITIPGAPEEPEEPGEVDLAGTPPTEESPPPEVAEDEKPETGERVTYETVCGEDVPYDRVLFGYARRWKQVPWVAFLHPMTKADVKEAFGARAAEDLTYFDPADATAQGVKGSTEGSTEGAPQVRTTPVWEVWHRARKQVYFLSCSLLDRSLKVTDDPLKLQGFFPMPEPLMFTKRDRGMVPVPLFCYYEEQAAELNRVTQRINKIVEALKVRGFYDSGLEGLDLLLESEDNTLLAARNVSALGDAPNLDKHIWLMPIEKLVNVLQQLYAQRQQIKQVIYEITGISDILRGASVASETATAQNIKNQWGTMRLRRMQRAVQRYVRDCLRLIAEVAGEKYAPDTWAQVTGLPFVMPDQKAQARAGLQALQQQAQMMPGMDPQMAQQAAMQMKQQAEKLAPIANSRDWGEVLGILRSDWSRSYRIDIETNSTIDLESTEDKKNMTEVLGALGQLFSGVGPVVEKGALPLPAFKAMVLTVVRRYRFGPEIEEELMKIPDALPQKDDGQAAKAKLELQGMQMEQAAKAKQLEREAEIAEREHQMKLEELAAKAQYQKTMAALKQQEADRKLQLMAAQAMMPAPQAPRETANAAV